MRTATLRLGQVLDVLEGVTDVLAGRVHEPRPPSWCVERGWADLVMGLSDAELERAESEGLAALLTSRPDVPSDLAALAEASRTLTSVEHVEGRGASPAMRQASMRKRAQVEALRRLATERLRSPQRVVDVGAGKGHLTRALAEELGRHAVGLERDPSRVEAARALAGDPTEHIATFEKWDGAKTPLSLGADDLVVGLHACGDLGDLIVERAAAASADVILVSCCLQKTRAETREASSNEGRARGFVAKRSLLGLSNLSARPVGVEDSMSGIMASRQTRHALRLLLSRRGVGCAPGEEARGINRRRMRRGLEDVAALALSSRGLAPAESGELAEIAVRAAEEFAVIRRLSLPRAMLSRLLEMAVVLDRAAALEDSGHETSIVTAFPASTSPRNLTIIARARAR